MKRPEEMLIYNLFPLLAGSFTDWEKHISRAADMGFNWLFVNPVQRLGASGSLYSIADYLSINPAFVDEKTGKTPEEQLRDALRKAESLGVRAMIDLVINHCAVDSPLLRTHPEWFVWEGDGRVAHPFADEDGRRVVWYVLAKSDHRNTRDREGLFRFFSDVVRYLIGLGFKGFRCDAAYQVPQTLLGAADQGNEALPSRHSLLRRNPRLHTGPDREDGSGRLRLHLQQFQMVGPPQPLAHRTVSHDP